MKVLKTKAYFVYSEFSKLHSWGKRSDEKERGEPLSPKLLLLTYCGIITPQIRICKGEKGEIRIFL